jgi:hypothetical protein
MRVVVMWIVKTINRDNITDIVEYVQEISKINDKDITLSLNSSLGFAETFLYLYEIMRVLLEKGILVKKGPQIIGNVVLINENVYKLKDFSLEDAVWWLVHSNMLQESFESILVDNNLITINDFVLKRG